LKTTGKTKPVFSRRNLVSPASLKLIGRNAIQPHNAGGRKIQSARQVKER